MQTKTGTANAESRKATNELVTVNQNLDKVQRELLTANQLLVTTTQQIDQVKIQLQDEQSNSTAYTNTINQLQQEISQTNDELTTTTNEFKAYRVKQTNDEKALVDSFETKLREKEKELTTLGSSRTTDVTELEKKHGTDLAELEQKHGTNLTDLEQKHGTDLTELERKHGTNFTDLEQKHGTDIDALNQKHGIDITVLEQQHKDELATANEQHKQMQKVWYSANKTNRDNVDEMSRMSQNFFDSEVIIAQMESDKVINTTNLQSAMAELHQTTQALTNIEPIYEANKTLTQNVAQLNSQIQDIEFELNETKQKYAYSSSQLEKLKTKHEMSVRLQEKPPEPRAEVRELNAQIIQLIWSK
jgi:chromosome segregation ATPase